jgi:hypothetical protein
LGHLDEDAEQADDQQTEDDDKLDKELIEEGFAIGNV